MKLSDWLARWFGRRGPASAPSYSLATVYQAPSKCSRCGFRLANPLLPVLCGEALCGPCKSATLDFATRLLEQAASGASSLKELAEYTLLGELGAGGMGAVFLARCRNTNTQVALKVVLPQGRTDARARALFLREIDNTRTLHHPNIVRLLSAGDSGEGLFFTMEYCDGGSVDKLLKERGGVLPVGEAVAITLQALRGLEYAHKVELPEAEFGDGTFRSSVGLVHRDLKPHNLFLAGRGEERTVKIGDFGLAKAFETAGLSGRTQTGTTAGTLIFMPRQQLVNFKYVRPDVDLWAITASLYFMITGHPPRDFSKGKDPLQIIMHTNAVPIRRRTPALPARLATVIDFALVDSPAIHFKSASDLRQALESAL